MFKEAQIASFLLIEYPIAGKQADIVAIANCDPP